MFDNSTQTRVTGEEGLPTEELPPSDWHVVIFLINDWCGKTPPTVGGVLPRQVVLDVGEQAKQIRENKPIIQHFSVVSASFPAFRKFAEFWLWL